MKTNEEIDKEIETLNETFKGVVEDYVNSTNCTNCIFRNTCDDYQLNGGYSLCESFKTLDNLNIE